MTQSPNNSDELETIKQIMMTVARRCETISEIQQQNTYAIQDHRRDMELLSHKIDRNATAIDRLTNRVDRIGNQVERMGDRFEQLSDRVERIDDRIERLATLQAQTELTLQTFVRHMDNEVQRIWEQIQAILSELRNRFSGNGKGD